MRPALAALLLAGCATSPARPVAPNPVAPINVVFECERGTRLGVRFEDEMAVVDTGDGVALRLPQQPSGSGFRYGTPRHMMVGKGDNLTWTVGRMVPEDCRAIDGAGNGARK
ncbi:MliC family protein [Polymorphobacter sp.]|uniref:MliC family protein n=1 Tax=Polymorphobacter sp. TaxID=1909290 RepID=UPI003F6FC09F